MTKDTLDIPESFLSQIIAQAEAEYPSECCGMIFRPVKERGALSRLRPCKNVQDEYHRRDAEVFPRTAKTAYFIDPRELLAIQKELRQNSEEIAVIYHSHIDAGAYFSEEDTRMAAPEGIPAYPGVEYLVVSVRGGRVNGHKLFRWNPKERKFI